MDIDSILQPPNPSSAAAFILFSSGSTGRPKGIVLEHQAACTSTHAFSSAWGVGPGTCVFQFAAFIFDVSVADMAMSLTRGACVCIPSDHEHLHDTAGAIRRLRANYVSLAPSVAALLSPADVPGLKTLVLGGEAPTRENIRTWAACLNLVICYGPAEYGIPSRTT
jgi:non-ribosomal peptide synthetase component F